IAHGDETMTYYASLGEIIVTEGEQIEQGDVIGSAGQNLFGQDNGIHVHCEVVKDGKKFNPETLFNKPVSMIGSSSVPKAADASNGDDADEETPDDEHTEEDEEAEPETQLP